MNDEHPHHTERHLSHFVRMGMIHVRAMLTQDKLVNKSLARLYVWLRQTDHAIHTARQDNSMPMDRSVFREMVRHKNTNAVSLYRFYGWPRR